ncbi:hypothetical protein GCM10010172_04530 [Paractinoplanes ferrugineus]|uniref:Uncharacterized protein n=1 Tax=Paractinoplanes ferrugineus TaxID=113564 RepID=A0A919J9W9_9ACTN|nr:hypothetical protein [Actinoplanes ferrugineus]GIE16838.1 hypothetical protein Afe05nite_86780 [Actinoplanes ferrugineus]
MSDLRPHEVLAEIATRDLVLAAQLRGLKADFRDDRRVLDLLDGLIGALGSHEAYARNWADRFAPRSHSESREAIAVPLRPSSPGEDTRAWKAGQIREMLRNRGQW